MKSRILSLLVALAIVLSLAVPAFAQTGETTEDNNLPDVTGVTDEVETDEDLPEETEEEEENPAESSDSEDNNDALQNITDNDDSGSAEDNEENVQEEADAVDFELENDNSDDNEDDSEEESGSEDDNIDEADTESEDDKDAEEDENGTEEDAENSDDELNSEESEAEEEDKIESEEEDNASKDDEEETDQEVENVNGEDEAEEYEDEHEEEIEATVENDAEEGEEESEEDETVEDSDNSTQFRLLTVEDLEDIDLEDAEVVPVNSVVFMAAGAAKSEPLMAAAKSSPVYSGTCGENLTWELDENYVLTISGSGNMYDSFLTNNPWSAVRESITGLNIGEGVTSIGKYAFYWFDSPNLTSVYIPASVKYIGESAFTAADHIRTYQFGHSADSELTIATYAFLYNLDHNEAYHLVDTTVKVPDANNINPAISGYDWIGSLRKVTFKSTSSDSGTSNGSGNSSGSGPADTPAEDDYLINEWITNTVTHFNAAFTEDANTSKVNNDLAKISIAASTAAYNYEEAKEYLTKLGFTDFTYYDLKSGEDTVGHYIAHKTILDENGEPIELYAVLIRGTNGTVYEWKSNFNPGTGDIHEGFKSAEEKVLKNLKAYIDAVGGENNFDSGNYKMWITGHSRGAAVGNILATEIPAPPENVFAYLYATPQTTMDPTMGNTRPLIHQANIKNFVIDGDVVARVPTAMYNYSRYGITYHWDNPSHIAGKDVLTKEQLDNVIVQLMVEFPTMDSLIDTLDRVLLSKMTPTKNGENMEFDGELIPALLLYLSTTNVLNNDDPNALDKAVNVVVNGADALCYAIKVQFDMYAVENNIDTSDFQSLINSGFEAAKKQLLTDLTEPNEKNVGYFGDFVLNAKNCANAHFQQCYNEFMDTEFPSGIDGLYYNWESEHEDPWFYEHPASKEDTILPAERSYEPEETYATPLGEKTLNQMVDTLEKRNTSYDIAMDTILKNSDGNLNLHNVAAAVYKASDIVGTTHDLIFSKSDQDKQDELMLKLLKENFAMYVAPGLGDSIHVDKELAQDISLSGVPDVINNTIDVLGLADSLDYIDAPNGIVFYVEGTKVMFNSIDNAVLMLHMQANYERTIEYIDNLQSSVDKNTSLYRACEKLREEVTSNRFLGVSNSQWKENGAVMGDALIKEIRDAGIKKGYLMAKGATAASAGTAATGSASVATAVESFAGEACTYLLGWEVGAFAGQFITSATKDMLENEEDLLRLYIATEEIHQAVENAQYEDARYDATSLYLTARDADYEKACLYYVNSGKAKDFALDVEEKVLNAAIASSPIGMALAPIEAASGGNLRIELNNQYPEAQEFFDAMYHEKDKLNDVREAMGLPTY